MYTSIHFEPKKRAATTASEERVRKLLREIVGAENVLVDPEKAEPYGAGIVHD